MVGNYLGGLPTVNPTKAQRGGYSLAMCKVEDLVSATATDDKKITLDEKLWSCLPQTMIEEILARMPIRNLYQCRSLSRVWKWGGGSAEGERMSSPGVFEQTIASVSSKWPSFCPVLLLKEGLVGYNSISKTWDTIFDLNMFPSLPGGIHASRATSCAGSLVCFAIVDFEHNAGRDLEVDPNGDHSNWGYEPLEFEIYVANVVTKKWKRLPPRALMHRPHIMHLIVAGDGYEIILLTQLEHTEGYFVASTIVTQIYRSATKSWAVKSSRFHLPRWRTSLSNFVYLDGVFYIATGSPSPVDPALLMTHDVEKGTWNTMIPPLPVRARQLVKYHVLLCGSELMLVVTLIGEATDVDDGWYRAVFSRQHDFQIFKLDLTSGQIKDEASCPREKLIGVSIDQILAYGDCIYFGGRAIPKTPMMIYNVPKREWTYQTSAWEMPKSYMPPWSVGYMYNSRPAQTYYWTHYALEPGLNPFAEI